jgi:nitrilase
VHGIEGDRLRVGLAQIAPSWLDRAGTLERVRARTHEAADRGCALVVFGECFVPGYPFWIEHTDGARFESARQQRWYAHYLDQAVVIERGDLDPLRAIAAQRGIAIYLGILERPADRGGHSVYASLVYIDAGGAIASVHRKLVPTYEERLVWAPGDGHGLRTHRLGAFTLGGLNCWENWMPLARVALLAQGMDLQVAVWPGNPRNTEDITRFAAREGRSYVVSVCALLRAADVPDSVPEAELLRTALPPAPARGGSAVAAPDGSWLIEPRTDFEGVIVAELDHARVREARQSFDPVGHYSRPDVTQLIVDRRRQSVIATRD